MYAPLSVENNGKKPTTKTNAASHLIIEKLQYNKRFDFVFNTASRGKDGGNAQCLWRPQTRTMVYLNPLIMRCWGTVSKLI